MRTRMDASFKGVSWLGAVTVTATVLVAAAAAAKAGGAVGVTFGLLASICAVTALCRPMSKQKTKLVLIFKVMLKFLYISLYRFLQGLSSPKWGMLEGVLTRVAERRAGVRGFGSALLLPGLCRCAGVRHW